MDIRKSEEFRKTQQAKLEALAKEEVSARNLLTTYIYANQLKAKVFEQHAIGSLGLIQIMFVCAFGFSVLTMTNHFTRFFPRVAGFLGQDWTPRVVLTLLTVNAGRSVEQYLIEHSLAKEAYTEYNNVQQYYEQLKAKRLEQIGVAERVRLLTGVDLN